MSYRNNNHSYNHTHPCGGHGRPNQNRNRYNNNNNSQNYTLAKPDSNWHDNNQRQYRNKWDGNGYNNNKNNFNNDYQADYHNNNRQYNRQNSNNTKWRNRDNYNNPSNQPNGNQYYNSQNRHRNDTQGQRQRQYRQNENYGAYSNNNDYHQSNNYRNSHMNNTRSNYDGRNSNNNNNNNNNHNRQYSGQARWQPRSVSIEPKSVRINANDETAADSDEIVGKLLNCECISLVKSIDKDKSNCFLMDIIFDNLHVNPAARDRMTRPPKRCIEKQKKNNNNYCNDKKTSTSNVNDYGPFKYHKQWYLQRLSGLPLAAPLGKKEIDLGLLSDFDYYVTEKSDGLRLLFICDNISNQCYFMDRKFTFYLLDHPFYTKTLIYEGGPTILDGELMVVENLATKKSHVDSNNNNNSSQELKGEKSLYYNIFDCITYCGVSCVEEPTYHRFKQIHFFIDYFNQEYSKWTNKTNETNGNNTPNNNNNNGVFANDINVQGSSNKNSVGPQTEQALLPINFQAKIQFESNEIEKIANCIEYDELSGEYVFTHPYCSQRSLNDGLIFTPKYAAYLMITDYYSKYSFVQHSGSRQSKQELQYKHQNEIDKYDFAAYKASKSILKWKPSELNTIDFLIEIPLIGCSQTVQYMNNLIFGNNSISNDNSNNNGNENSENTNYNHFNENSESKDNITIDLYASGARGDGNNNFNSNNHDVTKVINGSTMTLYGKCVLRNKKEIETFLQFYNEFMKFASNNSSNDNVWIVECKWDFRNRNWVIMRNRFDKAHSNFVNNCDTTFETMMLRITKDDLIRMCKRS